MSQSLQKFVVSIRHQTHRAQIVGTGFVVDARHILTCAHVITDAGAVPGDTVRVVFAVPRPAGRNQPNAKATVLPDYWRDPTGDDVAVLQLADAPLPEGVIPALLASSAQSQGHRFAAFGYPQVGGDIKGFPADGTILGDAPRAGGGHYLALRSQELAQGMSGAPVLDTEIDRVVGMVTSKTTKESGTFRDAAMATPIDRIQTIWPALQLTPPETAPTPGTPTMQIEGSGTAVVGNQNLVVGAGATYIENVTIQQQAPPPQPAAPEPIILNVPRPPDHFQGRDDLIAKLAAQLTSDETETLSLEGKPGAGKTMLAAVLARHEPVRAHFPDGVLWASLGPDGSPMRILAQWADSLENDISNIKSVEDRQKAVANLIGQRQMLLVIDNVWTLEAANWLRCGGSSCVHLLTTRDEGLARQFAGATWVTDVPELTEASAFAVLQALAPETCAVDPEAARALTNDVGGLPLALELLGGYLGAPERHFFPDLSEAALAEMADPTRRLQLAASRLGGSGGAVTLAETIALSLEGLTDKARNTFYALGAFAPLPATFSRAAAEMVTETDGATLAQLAAVNLLERVDNSLAMNQTLADVASTQAPNLDAVQERHRAYYLALVNEDQENWQQIEAAYPQIQWAWQHAPDDESLLELIEALRIYQRLRGLWQDNIAWVERGIQIAKRENLLEEKGKLFNNIGTVYAALGEQDKALDFYNEALQIREKGEDRLMLASTLGNIGFVYYRLGKLEKALDYYHRSLPINEELADQPGLARDLNSIGLVYNDQNKLEKALECFNRALQINEELEDQWGVAADLNNMGIAYLNLGNLEKALDFYNRALSIMKDVGDKSALAGMLNNIGLIYQNRGELEIAQDFYNRALPIMEEIGDKQFERNARLNLATIFRRQKRFAEAVAQYEKVVVLDGLIQHPNLESDTALLVQVKAELAQQES